MESFINTVNGIVWSPALVYLCLGAGLFLSLRGGFLQLRHLKHMWQLLFQPKDNVTGVSSFQALSMTLAGRVGTGNIAGVATAITFGGPGAVFWMWISALLGMCTKFSEVTLAVHFRERNANGELVGGPMYYIKNGLAKHWRWLAAIYALFGVLTVFGTGNATQVNTIITAIDAALNQYAVVSDKAMATVNLVIGIVVAMLVERVWLKVPRQQGAQRAAYIGIFAAMAAILMYLEFPLPFAPSFYEIDLSEVPVLICSFSLGPVAGVVCELVKIILKLLLKGTTTAFVGDFANFVVGCSFILPATIIYHRFKTKKGAIVGMVTGTVVMAAFGSFFNAVYLLPAFSALYGVPLDQLVAMGTAVNVMINSVSTLVFFAVVPFNLLKGLIVSVLTTLLYKRIERLLRMR